MDDLDGDTINLVQKILVSLIDDCVKQSYDENIDDQEVSVKHYKDQLMFHELQTAARFKGLLRCLSNDSKLTTVAKKTCSGRDINLLKTLNDTNYHIILNSLSTPYNQVYCSLRKIVCDQLSSQLLIVQKKLQNFIQSQIIENLTLNDAFNKINNLVDLSDEDREAKFEENNFSTTAWLEYVVKLVRVALVGDDGVLTSSDDDDDEQEEEMHDDWINVANSSTNRPSDIVPSPINSFQNVVHQNEDNEIPNISEDEDSDFDDITAIYLQNLRKGLETARNKKKITMNEQEELLGLKQVWKSRLSHLEESVLQSAGKNDKDWILHTDLLNGKVSFIDLSQSMSDSREILSTGTAASSQVDDHEHQKEDYEISNHNFSEDEVSDIEEGPVENVKDKTANGSWKKTEILVKEMNIQLSVQDIIHTPLDQLHDLLSKHSLSLYTDLISGRVSFIETSQPTAARIDDRESENKINVLPEEPVESQDPKIRIANFAVDPVPKKFLSNNHDENQATSSTSHLAKSSLSSTSNLLPEEIDINFKDFNEERESQFTENIDLKTDILDSLPSDTFDEEDISSSIPSSEPVTIDLCDGQTAIQDGPSTSSSSQLLKPSTCKIPALKLSGSASFKFVKHEKSSIYYIQYSYKNLDRNSKETEPYVILNSIGDRSDRNLVFAKLFMAKKNFDELMKKVGLEDWRNVRLEVDVNTRQVIFHFKQFRVFVDWPEDYWRLRNLLTNEQNFIFFSKTSNVGLPPSIKRSYINVRKSFCKYYQRNSAFHSCDNEFTLGFEWIKHIMSPAEMVQRTQKLIESKIITATAVIQIEQQVRENMEPLSISILSKINNSSLPLTAENATIVDKLFSKYARCVYSRIHSSLDNKHDDIIVVKDASRSDKEDDEVEIISNVNEVVTGGKSIESSEIEIISNSNDQAAINEIIQIDDVDTGKEKSKSVSYLPHTYGEESRYSTEVREVISDGIVSENNSKRLDSHECPWNHLQEFQMCPKRFLICSYIDVIALAEHISKHFTSNQIPSSTQSKWKLFQKHIRILSSLSANIDESRCPHNLL